MLSKMPLVYLIVFFCRAVKNNPLDLGVIKSLRVIRVLRPLKTIERLPKLKVSCGTNF